MSIRSKKPELAVPPTTHINRSVNTRRSIPGNWELSITDGLLWLYKSERSGGLADDLDTAERLFRGCLEAIAEHRIVLAAVRAGQGGTP